MTLTNTLLEKRGILTTSEKNHFLYPDYDRDVHDPFLLTGMKEATTRIIKAMQEGEKIAIYSDYDMDGIPGAVVMSDFFKRAQYGNVVHYVPNRNAEGFGLNEAALTKLAKENVTLVITVDCGIRAVSQVARAASMGVDVIVTDHHTPGAVLPDAVVVLNPNKKEDTYPNKHLCGAGVAFKLVSALTQSISDIPNDSEKWSLDMVAAATVSDMVSLLGENRALVHFGLRVLRKSSRPGIRALCMQARTKQQYLTEDDVMFSLAPRINAASRMGHAGDALLLLVAGNEEHARTQASILEELNKERKSAVITMVKHIKKTVSAREVREPVLVVGDPRWQPGLLGLVAQRAVELYDRPVCVWGRGDAAEVKGSCRSDGSVNVVSLLESAHDVLVDYGGHEYSGGFSIRSEDVHKLSLAFSAHQSPAAGNTKKAAPDALLSLEDVTWKTYREIECLAPFGVGNQKPVFEFRDVTIAGVRRFGSGKAHMELLCKTEDREAIRAIQFFAGKELDEQCIEGALVTLRAHLEQSFFGGTPELRLRIVSVV